MSNREQTVILDASAIVVTTPKSQMENAAEEAQRCIQCGGGFYHRYFGKKPKGLKERSRMFYVEDGYVRGFGTIFAMVDSGPLRCEITGKEWGAGWYALMPAQTWRWIEPIKCKGFQGFRYFSKLFPEIKEVKVVGGWKDPKPEVQSEE